MLHIILILLLITSALSCHTNPYPGQWQLMNANLNGPDEEAVDEAFLTTAEALKGDPGGVRVARPMAIRLGIQAGVKATLRQADVLSTVGGKPRTSERNTEKKEKALEDILQANIDSLDTPWQQIRPPSQASDDDQVHIAASKNEVEVFYATDRIPISDKIRLTYGSELTSIQFGSALVKIPIDHRKGYTERPSIFRLEFTEDPQKHVVITTVTQLAADKFFDRVTRISKISKKRELFIFVHGYGVTFDDALRRTAQLYYDIEFAGVPILYSWPSAGSFFGYWADEETALLSAKNLKDFLIELTKRSNPDSIHLVGHSMGSRVVTNALAAIVADPNIDLPAIDQLVFAAPDIYADYFKTFASTLTKVANRITLYASSYDKALSLSKWFHWHTRAGESGKDITIIKGVDTIDVSALDTNLVGHFYYGDNRSVISDMFYLFRDKRSPADRFGMILITPEKPLYWSFSP